MVVRYLTTKVLPAVAVGATAVSIYCTAANAFFPPIVFGSDNIITLPTVSPQVPLPPPAVVPPVVPPVVISPPPFVPPPRPPHVPPPVVCPGLPRHCEVPEPTTIVVGLIGLAGLGVAAARKKLAKIAPDA